MRSWKPLHIGWAVSPESLESIWPHHTSQRHKDCPAILYLYTDMAPATVHLPNGATLHVHPVFGGLSFKNLELSTNRSAFPPGWTVVLNEDDSDELDESSGTNTIGTEYDNPYTAKQRHVHRYKRPSLQHDHLFISAISNPSSAEFKPPVSATRQIAMMLWATLWWYFHQPEPSLELHTNSSSQTPSEGKPRGEWRININQEGIFKGKMLLDKLERMGIVATTDSSVGTAYELKDAPRRKYFVTRRSFWQMDARTYLFSMASSVNSPLPGTTPISSRPGSPSRAGDSTPSRDADDRSHSVVLNRGALSPGLSGPFHSQSHLPTYYPPHPTQYTITNNIRHPIRPRPYRQGETFYVRYIPSMGQYLSFRVASLAPRGCTRVGPWTTAQNLASIASSAKTTTPRGSLSDVPIPLALSALEGDNETDVEILHRWMNQPRVSRFFGGDGPIENQEKFLKTCLSSRHSFPAIGCWDGKPFGFFEIYWVKEDTLGKYLGGHAGEYDRGFHCFVGEQEFRGTHRVKCWLSAMVHFCWLADMRTDTVVLEPRVDNTL